jgi:4-diphosphocytidyl-2-C-methyl-D-erythritol kinase
LKKVYRSCAKVNIFLKIVGTRENYHELVSRFILMEDLYDTMWFEPNHGISFDIVGDFECDKKDNTIYKAYEALLDYKPQKTIVEFCKKHKTMVYKNIPKQAGLGGGSSNAATFLKMLNEALKLELSIDELSQIGAKVGADVPFFVHGYKAANVSGIGEVVEEFVDDMPKIKLFMPEDIKCDTKEVFKTFRKFFIDELEPGLAEELKTKTSKEILGEYPPMKLNDLFQAVLKKYPEFYEHKLDGWFLSGSGSTLFKVK